MRVIAMLIEIARLSQIDAPIRMWQEFIAMCRRQ